MALLETRNLSKSFGGLQAINDVSLKVEPNTVHGLIGPNGSGKSTFFNLLTGVYQPDAGSYIEFDNVEVTGKPAHYIAEQGLSRTFQLLRLYGELSVLDNVLLGIARTPNTARLPHFSMVPRCVGKIRLLKMKCLSCLNLLGLLSMPRYRRQNYLVVNAAYWRLAGPLRCARRCCYWMSLVQVCPRSMLTV